MGEVTAGEQVEELETWCHGMQWPWASGCWLPVASSGLPLLQQDELEDLSSNLGFGVTLTI